MSELLLPETDLTPPPGYRPGILPQTEEERRTVRDINTAPGFRIIPMSEWPDLIAAGYNTSWWAWYVSSQASVGSCAAEAACNSLAITREKHGLPRIKFNPYALYHFTSGGVDRGSTLSGNLSALKNIGAVPMELWGRDKGWRQKPSAEALEAAKKYRLLEYYQARTWEELGSALLNGFCGQIGYPGHSITAVDLVNTSQLRYLNSWHENWGDRSPHNSDLKGGFGILNRSSLQLSYGIYCHQSPVHEIAA